MCAPDLQGSLSYEVIIESVTRLLLTNPKPQVSLHVIIGFIQRGALSRTYRIHGPSYWGSLVECCYCSGLISIFKFILSPDSRNLQLYLFNYGFLNGIHS